MSLKTKRRKRSTTLSLARLDRRFTSLMKKRVNLKMRRFGSGPYGALMIHPSSEHFIAAHVLRDPNYAVKEIFGIRVYLDPNIPPDRYYLLGDFARSQAISRLFQPKSIIATCGDL